QEHEAMTSPSSHVSDTQLQSNGSAPPPSRPHAHAQKQPSFFRKYAIYIWVAGALLICAIVFGALAIVSRFVGAPFNGPTWTVKKETLRVTIVERGSLESAENSDIIVRVKAGTKGGTTASTIKWVVDDGTQVRAGDPIVDLDDSGFQ